MYRPNGLGQNQGRRLLDQIAGGTHLQGAFDVGVVAVGGEDQDSGTGSRREDLPGGPEAVHQRHGDIHHDHVRLQLRGEGHRFATIVGFAHDGDGGIVPQQGTKALPHNQVVIDEQDGDGWHG